MVEFKILQVLISHLRQVRYSGRLWRSTSRTAGRVSSSLSNSQQHQALVVFEQCAQAATALLATAVCVCTRLHVQAVCAHFCCSGYLSRSPSLSTCSHTPLHIVILTYTPDLTHDLKSPVSSQLPLPFPPPPTTPSYVVFCFTCHTVICHCYQLLESPMKYYQFYFLLELELFGSELDTDPTRHSIEGSQ